MVFNIGGTVPIGIDVVDTAGAPTNAASNTLTITLPDGSTVTPSTTNPATGTYACYYSPVQAGRHLVYWVTTNPNTAYTDTFDVAESAPPLIIGLQEAKDFLNLDDSDQDDELRGFLEAVTAVVEGGDGKDFQGVGPVVRRTVTTRVDSYGCDAYVLPYTSIVSLTSGAYVSDGSTVSLTNYTFDSGILRPAVGAALPSYPWTLTYVVGRPSLPANIRMGALEILREGWSSQRATDGPRLPIVTGAALSWLGSEAKTLGFA